MKPFRTSVRRESTADHPTRLALLEATLALLRELPPDAITTEKVLARAAVSTGSMYHHFEDLSDLLETALVQRFAQGVDETIAAVTAITGTARDKASFLDAMHRVTEQSQHPARKAWRQERAMLIALAGTRPRLAARLAGEQARLTDALADLFRLAQSRRWMSRRFDPHAAAVLIQAYTLGRIVDDVVGSPMDPDAWNAIVNQIVDRVFG